MLSNITIIERFSVYNRKIKWQVFAMICFFTIGAWLDINGLWCELPIMVHELPEGWRLGSILSASTQVAQFAPILFVICYRYYPYNITYVIAIYIILGIGALSCLLLSFFWNATAKIFSGEYSVGLIVLNFSLALLDGTSSVTFLPYISGNFVKEYIIPNYIGESLAALIPSVLSLAQGLGKPTECRNETVGNKTEIVPIPVVPNYSVQVYFILMFLLLCISASSFSLLNFSKLAINERKSDAISNRVLPRRVDITEKENESFDSKDESDDDLKPSHIINSQSELIQNAATSRNNWNGECWRFLVDKKGTNDRLEKGLLFSFIFMVSFICYGVLPGLQTYSTLPYGNAVFNYAVNISFVFLPVAIIFTIWSYDVNILQISIEFSIACVFALYITILSVMSPCPPLVDTNLGSFLSIISWILAQAMFMRIRCLVAGRLERFGQKTMLTLGILTMFGQIFGGLIIFLVVNIFSLLKDKDPCTPISTYCNL